MPSLESVEREEEGNAHGNANVQEAPPPINVDADEEFTGRCSSMAAREGCIATS